MGQELATSILLTIDRRPASGELAPHTGKMVAGTGEDKGHLALRCQRLRSKEKPITDACRRCCAIATQRLVGVVTQFEQSVFKLIEQFGAIRRHHGHEISDIVVRSTGGMTRARQTLAQPRLCESAPLDQSSGRNHHALVFEAPDGLEADGLAKYAAALELDGESFEACLGSDAATAAVQGDMEAGSSAGVTGTPAFFINGIPLKGAQPVSEFQRIIDAELAAAG